MNKKFSNTKQRLLLAIGATGVVLGISAAAFLASMSSNSVATATDRTPVVTNSAAPSPSETNIETPTDIVEGTASLRTDDLEAAEQFIENQTGIKVDLKPVPIKTPSKPSGSTSGGSTSGSSGSTDTACESPTQSIWASCTAGYVAPKIVFAGVKSCSPVDREAGIWRVVIEVALSGGNHNGVIWSMDESGGPTHTMLLKGVTDFSESVPTSFMAEAYAKPMNGMGGSIDLIEGNLFPELELGGICN